MPTRPPVPPVNPLLPNATLQEVVAAMIQMQEAWIVREPLETGSDLQKFLTVQKAIDTGFVIYLGPGAPGAGGGIGLPPPSGLGSYNDLTPADPLQNLTVTSIPTGYFVEFDAPTYGQGGGNAFSIIFRAPWDGVLGNEPVFADALEVGRCTERSPILVFLAEPGTYSKFWAQPVTHAEEFNQLAPQTAPTGGTNGVGDDPAGLFSNDHIANLSADKLIANSIAVGIGVETAGFISGSYGFQLKANGDMEVHNAIVRGTIYALGGLIGGATIDATGVESNNYDPGVAGWRLDNGTGEVLANAGLIGGAVIDAGGIESDNYAAGTAGWRLDNATGTVFANKGEFVGVDVQISSDVTFEAYTAAIAGGDIVVGDPFPLAGGYQTYDSRTITPTGGKAPYAYMWVVQNDGYAQRNIGVQSGQGTDTATFAGSADDQTAVATAICLVTDANGRMTSDSITITATHSTGGGPGD